MTAVRRGSLPGVASLPAPPARKPRPSLAFLRVRRIDAGLRRGEALALRWGHGVWGQDEDDPSRGPSLIRESRSRGGPAGPTKSGRARKVALSFRLRAVLELLHQRQEHADAEAPVLSSSFRRRAWERIVTRAAVGHRRFKDLRDTFASALVSAGVPLAWVSKQLGHADLVWRNGAR